MDMTSKDTNLELSLPGPEVGSSKCGIRASVPSIGHVSRHDDLAARGAVLEGIIFALWDQLEDNAATNF